MNIHLNRRLRTPHQAALDTLQRMIGDATEVYGADDQRTRALASAHAALAAAGALHDLIGQLDQAEVIPSAFEDTVRRHQRQLTRILDGGAVHAVQETLG
jgi:hypothetical protein